MFARHIRMMGVLYLLADALAAPVSIWVAYAIRTRLHMARALYPPVYYVWMAPVAAGIVVSVGLALGIYREIREEELRRAIGDPLKLAFLSTILLFAFVSALQAEYVSRLLLALYGAVDLAMMIGFRLVGRRLGGSIRRTFAGFRHFLL